MAELVMTDKNTFIPLDDDFKNVVPGQVIHVDFNEKKQRTLLQNNAIYKYFGLLSTSMNDAGYDKRVVYSMMRDDFTIQWTPNSVKEDLWRPIQSSMYDTTSTTQLETGHVSSVHMNLNKWTAEHLGISVPFPSREER